MHAQWRKYNGQHVPIEMRQRVQQHMEIFAQVGGLGEFTEPRISTFKGKTFCVLVGECADSASEYADWVTTAKIMAKLCNQPFLDPFPLLANDEEYEPVNPRITGLINDCMQQEFERIVTIYLAAERATFRALLVGDNDEPEAVQAFKVGDRVRTLPLSPDDAPTINATTVIDAHYEDAEGVWIYLVDHDDTLYGFVANELERIDDSIQTAELSDFDAAIFDEYVKQGQAAGRAARRAIEQADDHAKA